MSTDDFARLKALLLQLRELPVDERPSFLDEQCADNPELRRELESLLAADSTDRSILDTGALAAGVLPPMEPDLPMPERIGPYRPLDELGRGGMGIVYRAEQTEPIRREVAVKLIRTGMDRDLVLARFEAERHTLAKMDHPHIARVLDAGSDEQQRPYFVMELVKGEPITTYCSSTGMDIRQRVELMRKVCDGIRHAHQRGILHRDIKPSNVMVAERAAGPEVKIIDFGIAKAIEGDADGASTLTMFGAPLGTPDYMSPEQAGAIEGGVDVRTDVYSAGVLLYELLTGRRPHRFEKVTPQEIIRVLGETDPERPSTAVTREGGAAAESNAEAPSRHVSVDRLRRELAGDLDNIILKAMHKDPDRRYSSIGRLDEDLRRYLAGLPVEARGDALSYRAGKFVRRHRVGVTAAVGGALLLASLAINMTVQSARVAAERDRATVEAETAKQVSDFLVEIFKVSDAYKSTGDELTARQVLDNGAERIETELADQPEVQATLLLTIGHVYRTMYLVDQAAPLQERAVAIRAELFGTESIEYAEAVNALGEVRNDQGRPEDAIALYEEALAIRRRELGNEDYRVAISLANLGSLYEDVDRLEEAEACMREALAIREAHYGPDHETTAISVNNLAYLMDTVGEYEEAEELYRRSLAIRLEVLGTENYNTSVSMNNLASYLERRGRLEEAGPLYVEAAEIRGRIFEPGHPAVLRIRNNLAGYYLRLERYEEALAIFSEILVLRREAQGHDHPDVSRDLNNLGVTYVRMGRIDEALPLLEEGMAIHIKAYGENHRGVAFFANNLGTLYRRQGDLDTAEKYFTQALAIRVEILGEDHPQTHFSRNNLGFLYYRQERYADAEALLRQNLALTKARGEIEPAQHNDTCYNLGMVLLDTGRAAEAEDLLREALELRLEMLPEGNSQLTSARLALARCLVTLGEYAEAEPLLEAAGEATLAESVDVDPTYRRQTLESLIAVHEGLGRPQQAAEVRAVLTGGQ